MGTDKRERKKANRRAREAAEEAAARRRRQLRFVRNVILLAVALILVALLMNALSGCSKQQDPSAEGVGSTGRGCPPAAGVEKPVIDFTEAPPTCIDASKRYTATFQTTKGTVTVDLDTERTPDTTNAFVFMARYGYFDGTDLFRTEAASGIIQGGSPHTQDNSDGGPGFTIKDEGLPFTADDYGPGTLAMARTELPDSGGGQFFFLANENGRYLGDAAQLGPSAGTYVVFGRTTKGLDVLKAIAALDDGSGAPSRKVTVTKVTIAEA
jgi:cyclophilin family peptidyl-prolyl cis-trans isomerase